MNDVDTRAGRFDIPRSRGAASGFLLILLGLWGALVPFIGPPTASLRLAAPAHRLGAYSCLALSDQARRVASWASWTREATPSLL